jgi:hypothetical protein
MRTLADRAVYACGRLMDDYPTTAAMSVPREALVAVGTFDPSASEIVLTGDSQRLRRLSGWICRSSIHPSFAADWSTLLP